MRLPLRVVEHVRRVVPNDLPLFVRISATDWVEGGWDLEQSVDFARHAKGLGVDLIDVSSGALVPKAHIPVAKGYPTQPERDSSEGPARRRQGEARTGGRCDSRGGGTSWLARFNAGRKVPYAHPMSGLWRKGE
jgi:2,4-dienoyl-CoA reductase-like NADH-dependent reductase (Old Yellow Enzyme family)